MSLESILREIADIQSPPRARGLHTPAARRGVARPERVGAAGLRPPARRPVLPLAGLRCLV